MLTRTKGSYFGHPSVTTDYHPEGRVIIHDRRGGWAEIRRSRMWAGISILVGLILVGLIVNRTVSSKGLYLVGDTIVMLIIAGFSLVITYWFLYGRGWEKIHLANGKLHIRVLPLDFGRGATIEKTCVSHVQVEKDNDWRPGRYRVQILDADGCGMLPSLGALSAIPTQDEATALANAIGQQFHVSVASGIRTAAKQSPTYFEQWVQALGNGSKDDRFLTLEKSNRNTTGRIELQQSDVGTLVIYVQSMGEQSLKFIIGAIFIVFMVKMFLATVPEFPLVLLCLVPFSILGLVSIAVLIFEKKAVYLHGNDLGLRTYAGPIIWTDEKISLENVEQVGTVVSWDSYNKMYFRVVARAKHGADLVIIDHLPENDGHVLVQALHDHLGLPIRHLGG